MIYGPDAKEQHRRLKSVLKKNERHLNKSLNELSSLKKKTSTLIKQFAKKNDIKNIRIFAKELYQINQQYNRLYTSKAHLDSISMKIEEVFQLNMMQQSISTSTGLMKEVNSLIHLPQMRNTMMELEKELLRSGLINEIMDDTLDIVDNSINEEDLDEQVEQIIAQYTKDQLDKFENIPRVDLPKISVEECRDDEVDSMLNEMKEKLNALQN